MSTHEWCLPDDPDDQAPLPPPEQRWLNAVEVMNPIIAGRSQSARRPSTATGP